jgi:hypothetical protein
MLDFLIIGAAKAGSTTLSDLLSKSNDINFCRVKEPCTLYKHDNYSSILSEYESLFESKDGLKGEATTGYSEPMVLNQVLKNLESFSRIPKFILVVRNPHKRIESSLMQRKKLGERDFDPKKLLYHKLNLYSRSMYGLIISKYIESFGKDSLLLLKFDDFIDNKQNIIDQLTNFLSIRDLKIEYFEHKNTSIGSRQNPLISRIYLRYFKNFYDYLGLSKLTKIAPILKNTFGEPISSKYQLCQDEQERVRDILKYDSIEFEKIAGFNYFDLKH